MVLRDLGFIASFAGAIFGSCIIYIFPSLMHIAATRKAVTADQALLAPPLPRPSLLPHNTHTHNTNTCKAVTAHQAAVLIRVHPFHCHVVFIQSCPSPRLECLL